MTFYTDFAEYYEAIFPFSSAVYAYLQQYIAPTHRQVLDIGCGTGHYIGAFAETGHKAVGIDLDPAMIAVARACYPEAEVHVMDMVDVADLDRSFDAVYCIGNTAAHLTPARFERFLDGVRQVLRPGGPWILQVMNWDYVLTQERVNFPVLEGETSHGTAVAFYRTYRDISPAQVTFATRLEAGGKVVFEDEVPLYPLRSAKIEQLHAARCFRLLDHAASYAGGAPFDPTTFSANIFAFEREE